MVHVLEAMGDIRMNSIRGLMLLAILLGLAVVGFRVAGAAQPNNDVAELGMPVGTIIAFAGPADRFRGRATEWLLCDGTELASSEHQDLFHVIQYSYGGGNGRFKVPDLRGVFLRGLDSPQGPNSSAGKDSEPARAVGSYQGDSTKLPNNAFRTSAAGKHSHRFHVVSDDKGGTDDHVAVGDPIADRGWHETSGDGDHDHVVNSGGDTETRPKNIAINYYIKRQ